MSSDNETGVLPSLKRRVVRRAQAIIAHWAAGREGLAPDLPECYSLEEENEEEAVIKELKRPRIDTSLHCSTSIEDNLRGDIEDDNTSGEDIVATCASDTEPPQPLARLMLASSTPHCLTTATGKSPPPSCSDMMVQSPCLADGCCRGSDESAASASGPPVSFHFYQAVPES